MKPSCRTAVTLTELLIVVAIIGLLAAILFPVFRHAKRESQKADGIAKARQIVVGLQLYREDYGDWPPRELWEAVETRHLAADVLYIPGDPRPEGLGHWVTHCFRIPTRVPEGQRISFEDAFAWQSGRQVYLEELKAGGETNPALVVYRGLNSWGDRVSPRCSSSYTGYQGVIIRGRMDGSVTVDQFRLGDRELTWFCVRAMFTDIPPEEICKDIMPPPR